MNEARPAPPSIGSVWREDDARFVRHVRVVAVLEHRAQIERVAWDQARHVWEPNGTRVSYALLTRFGKSGGYKPVSS